jgi:U3 small nucleolar RNA-associated protein 20
LEKNAADSQTSLRSQALRALLPLPRLAEQHSRDLVPLFLALEAPSSENSVHWHRNDRISLLTLFTRFNNPRGLYKSSVVRSTLYALLHNGDQKIQTLALDAILTWKDVELVTYKENLHNLLDDKKFREELTSLIHVYADDSPVQEEHRQGLMEVVVRILFGSALVRHGNGEGKRSAILSALANLRPEETRIFVDLALLPFAETRGVLEKDGGGFRVVEEIVSRYVEDRKMMGFVVMAQNFVKALGGGISPYLTDLLEPLFVCMWKSKLDSNAESETADDVDAEFQFDDSNSKAARSVRKMSMKLLNLLINTCPGFEWESYISLIFREFISDKLEALSDENIQSPSNRLQFLETLSKHPQTIFSLSRCHKNAIPSILRCIENSKVHISVFNTVLGIFVRIFQASVDPNIGMMIKDEMVMTHLTNLLEHITVLLIDDHFQHTVNVKQTLDLIIEVLRLSTPLVQTPIHAEHLIEPLISLLGKPGQLVGEKLKGGILESIVNLLPLCSDFRPNAKTYDARLQAVSQLFGSLNNRAARTMLCQVIDVFAEVDPSLKGVGELVTDLNAYDTRRLDTPDFDRRLSGFAKLNEEAYLTLSPQAWTPIVYNMLFFVQDTDEMSLRTGAAFGLQRFFTMAENNNLSPGFSQLLSTAVFPAIKKGFRNSNEIVRKEFTGVLNSLVKHCSDWSPISDLKVLLAEGDEEANFFNNIYHIQQHRQLRAITRLSKVAADGLLKASNVEQLFIPLLEKFSLDNNVERHNVTAEATRGIGALSGALGWKSYRQLVKRYISMMKTGDEKERAVVRTVCVVVEMAGKVAAARVQRMSDSKVVPDLDEEANREGSTEDDFLVRAVVHEFYPPMLRYLHRHEESTLTLRIPVALALVKVLRLLPEKFLVSKLPAVLTDVCHILKSRSQEARDTCRKTLNEIMTLLGPRFFSFILKELKTALVRGYQLHVLGFTVHSMLTHLPAEFGDLDSCVKDIVDVLVDDIFGVTGAEKDSEEYTTTMKEVKSSKSYDSFEILASITSMTRMYAFVSPLKKLLYELGSVKEGRKMNEILRRIQLGIMRSKGSEPLAVLDFCVSLFKGIQSEAANSDQPTSEATPNQFIVDLKFKRKFEINHFKTNAPKLLRFSLDTITALIRKYEYLVREEQVGDLVPVLGDCLMSDVDELRIPALRLLGRMISLPINSVEEGIDVFVERAVQFIKESPLTKAELCQASIKFLALLIRDRKSYTPNENVVVYLLERIRPDLEEPDRQGVSFTLIRAILSRRLVISEVYDIMAAVGSIMITNQSRSVRDTTRALYLQFLMDYPQGRDRLKKQISFLIKNLQYEHATGRQSVMEVLHQIVSKFGDELLQPIVLDLFVGLLLPLVNDESATCREMASRLIQSIIENADDERSKTLRTMLRLWAQQGDKPALLKASLHVYGLLLEHGTRVADDTDLCIECVTEIVLQSGDESRSGVLWEVTEQALQLFTKLIKIDPSRAFLSDHENMWKVIERLLMCESAGVRLASSRVVGIFFGRAESLEDGQLKVESLSLGVSNLTALARQFLEQIKSPESTAEIGLQAVKNLIFLGRHFYQTNCMLPRKKTNLDTDEESVKTSFTWLVSRVAAEIRYEHSVAEVLSLSLRI